MLRRRGSSLAWGATLGFLAAVGSPFSGIRRASDSVEIPLGGDSVFAHQAIIFTVHPFDASSADSDLSGGEGDVDEHPERGRTLTR